MTRWLLILVCALGCNAPSRALPPLPATMPSVLGPVPVERVDSIPGDPDALADVRFMERRVRIRRNLSPAAGWQAYYHEQCHLNAYDQNVSPGGEDEEKWCDAVANLRVIEMQAPASVGR